MALARIALLLAVVVLVLLGGGRDSGTLLAAAAGVLLVTTGLDAAWMRRSLQPVFRTRLTLSVGSLTVFVLVTALATGHGPAVGIATAALVVTVATSRWHRRPVVPSPAAAPGVLRSVRCPVGWAEVEEPAPPFPTLGQRTLVRRRDGVELARVEVVVHPFDGPPITLPRLQEEFGTDLLHRPFDLNDVDLPAGPGRRLRQHVPTGPIGPAHEVLTMAVLPPYVDGILQVRATWTDRDLTDRVVADVEAIAASLEVR